MFKLSDLVQNTAAIAAAAAPSQFAMHAMTRDVQGKLTYTKVLWANTSESVQTTANGSGQAYTGMEEFISGYTQDGLMHNSTSKLEHNSGSVKVDSANYFVKIKDANTASPKFIFNNDTNPTLILRKGATYTFTTDDFSTQNFPLYISATQGDTNYTNEWSNGVSYSRSANGDINSSILTSNNTLTTHALVFTVPFDAPSTLWYCSGTNANSSGRIVIRDASTDLINRSYDQVRFDNQKLTYYINSQGFLVARYGADYSYT